MYNKNMDISGPSFCGIRNGKPCNKYLIVTRVQTLKGITNVLYFFDTKDDAELYLRFLQQVEGEKFVNSVIHSNRTPIWERREFVEFKESIDWEELRVKVKDIKFTTETVFVEMRKRK